MTRVLPVDKGGSRNRPRKGFTLIELLIVIAIILILVAIALPNFLEAQIRARVTRAKGEIRSLAIAMEAYRLDWKIYPGRSANDCHEGIRAEHGLVWLTSPVAYISQLPEDPFPITINIHFGDEISPPYCYFLTGVDNDSNDFMLHPHGGGRLRTWLLYSAGPDRPEIEVNPGGFACMAVGGPFYTYNPTNGTKSKGDIWLFGGETMWMGVDKVKERGCLGVKTYLKESPRSGVIYDDQLLIGRFPNGQTL